MPAALKAQVEAAATASGRSMNAEIVDRLARSFASVANRAPSEFSNAELLEELIERYGDRVQIIVSDRT